MNVGVLGPEIRWDLDQRFGNSFLQIEVSTTLRLVRYMWLDSETFFVQHVQQIKAHIDEREGKCARMCALNGQWQT